MNKKNIPEIRFSGFDDEWKNKELGQIYAIKAGDFLSKMDSSDKNKIPIISGGVEPLGYTNKSNFEANSITIARAGSAGYVSFQDKPFWLNDKCFGLTAIISDIHNYFMYSSLLKNKNNLDSYVTLGTLPTIKSTSLKKVSFNICNISEQNKIGVLFKNIDDLISKTEKQYNYFKNIKESLLNKMFPSNYSNEPEIRFKEFEDEWSTNRLGNIGTFRSAGVDKIYREHDNRVYMINFMDVYNRKIINEHTYKYLMKTTATVQECYNCNLIKGDILITPSSETIGDIGMPLTIKETFTNVVYSYHLIRFRPNKELFNIYFSDYVLTSEFVRSQMLYKAQGVQRIVLSKSDFEDLNIKLPSSASEQTKIGTFLKNLDDLIELIKQKHEKLKNIKNALLDKMFC
ncbi:restriction endonuclease subunit S [Metamycoplasma spumans]|uniref:restriction endonuclease subunit S n=1 Tax=Metamycoplasma spumans TaxID=92406 RepID=UPI0034DD9E5E